LPPNRFELLPLTSISSPSSNVLLAFVAAEQEQNSSTSFTLDLFQRIDQIMFKSAQITETVLHIMGRLAKFVVLSLSRSR